MNPLVSICIPLYNNASTIEETVRSVISQTYRPLELVIVDDNSTDNSYDVVNSILAELPENLDVLRHLERNTSNLGMSGNWNPLPVSLQRQIYKASLRRRYHRQLAC